MDTPVWHLQSTHKILQINETARPEVNIEEQTGHVVTSGHHNITIPVYGQMGKRRKV